MEPKSDNKNENTIDGKNNNVAINIGGYHKIDLVNIHYMIFDFNKDSIVEKKEKI